MCRCVCLSVTSLRLEATTLRDVAVRHCRTVRAACVRLLSGMWRLRLTSCQHTYSWNAHKAAIVVQTASSLLLGNGTAAASPTATVEQECGGRSREVRKSGPKHRGSSPKHWPEGLCESWSMHLVCACWCVVFKCFCEYMPA